MQKQTITAEFHATIRGAKYLDTKTEKLVKLSFKTPRKLSGNLYEVDESTLELLQTIFDTDPHETLTRRLVVRPREVHLAWRPIVTELRELAIAHHVVWVAGVHRGVFFKHEPWCLRLIGQTIVTPRGAPIEQVRKAVQFNRVMTTGMYDHIEATGKTYEETDGLHYQLGKTNLDAL